MRRTSHTFFKLSQLRCTAGTQFGSCTKNTAWWLTYPYLGPGRCKQTCWIIESKAPFGYHMKTRHRRSTVVASLNQLTSLQGQHRETPRRRYTVPMKFWWSNTVWSNMTMINGTHPKITFSSYFGFPVWRHPPSYMGSTRLAERIIACCRVADLGWVHRVGSANLGMGAKKQVNTRVSRWGRCIM